MSAAGKRPPLPREGIWRVMPSPEVTEMLAQCGLTFQILDCEHGNYGYQALLTDALACRANQCSPWIRVGGSDKVEVQRCLDIGAEGVVFPGLRDYDDFARAASWMDYAPAGTRGFNPFVRAGSYGIPVAPTDSAWFVPIVETLTAVEDLDRILGIERIDLVYLGTYDLSAQLGCPGQMGDPRVVEVVERILSACRARSIPTGMMALNRETAAVLRERGVDVLVHGVETHRIKEKFATLLRD